MANKEATARIKINRLLEEAGWSFFDDQVGPANIVLEPNIEIKPADIEALRTAERGTDFPVSETERLRQSADRRVFQVR